MTVQGPFIYEMLIEWEVDPRPLHYHDIGWAKILETNVPQKWREGFSRKHKDGYFYIWLPSPCQIIRRFYNE